MANVKDLLVNGSARVIGTIYGNATSANKVNHSLTFGSKSFNGSSAQTITLADLGGKPTQSAVSSPSASGTEISFIDTISQNTNGVITATKKTVRDASASQSGVVNTGAQTFAGDKTFTGMIYFPNVTSGLAKGIQWTVGDNDFARIRAGATGSNGGYLEIATADDANEPIYIRQYSGVFGTLNTTLTLLDASHNTIIPNALTVGTTTSQGSSYKFYVNGTSYFNGDISGVGNISPLANNSKNLGSSSLKWANAYATTFHGALDGNAATATKFTSAQSITLTGDTTGTASSQAGWSISTTTSKLSRAEHLDTVEKLDAFIEASKLKYATVASVGGVASDGMIISVPWSSTGWGHQVFLDDSAMVMQHRHRYTKTNSDGSTAQAWSGWATILDSSNYNNYSLRKISSSTDNAIARWDGTDGKAIQNSGILIDDNNNLLIGSGHSIYFNNSASGARITNNGTSRLEVLNGSSALPIAVGGIIASNSYSDSSKLPNNGVFSKGHIRTEGSLYFTNGNTEINWDGDTYRQRILNNDDSNADTPVFTFQQSTNNGSSWDSLLTIRDNGKIILQDRIGGIYRLDASATTMPVIQISNNNVDTTILRIDGDNRTSHVNTLSYGFELNYRGTGGGEDNALELISSCMNGSTKDKTLSIANNGKVGIGGNYNTNYRFAVNGTSYFSDNISIKAGKEIKTVGTKATSSMIRFLDNTSDAYGNGISIGGGGVAILGAGESASSLSVPAGTETLYLLSDGAVNIESNADTIANRIGFQVNTSGHLLPVKAEAGNNSAQDIGSYDYRIRDIYANTLRLRTAASNPSQTAGARLEFSYYNSSTDLGQPVFLHYCPNDSYRAPAGLKIFGGSGASPAWLEVEGNVYAPTFNGALSGNAATTTKLQTARTIWGQSFDGTQNITGNFSMSGGDQINMTGASWDGFAFNYNANKKDSNGNAIGQSTRFYDGKTVEIVRFTAGGSVGIGTSSPAYKLHAIGDIYADGGWLRTNGARGWYNESYGGGMYMTDSNFVRNYNSKALSVNINSNNNWGIGTHRLAAVFKGNDHVSILLSTNSLGYGLCVNNDGNWYWGKRTTSSETSTSGDTYVLYGNTSHVSPDSTNAVDLGLSNHRWRSGHIYRDFNIYGNESTGDESHIRFNASDNSQRAIITFNGNIDNAFKSSTHLKIATSYGDIRLAPANGNVNIGDGSCSLTWRKADNGGVVGGLESGIYYSTPGRESVVFANMYAHTGWIFVNGIRPSNKTNWNALGVTPAMQIHHNAVYINRPVRDADTSDYNLYVNGSGNITGNLKLDGSITNLAVNGGIYWNPYVESASDASDAASITVVKAGVAGGTELRISQANDANDIVNISVPTNDAARINNNIILNAANYTNYAATSSHTHSYLPLSGGTMTGVIRSTYKSGTWVNSLTNSAISLDDAAGSYGGWICGPTKDGRIAISTYQNSDNVLYFGYGERGRTTNSFAQQMTWNGSTNTLSAGKVYGAVWNDYAEYRKSYVTEPGRVVIENGDGTLSLSTKRLQRGAEVISDTFGFAIGETDECKTPIAATGRVLAYTYEPVEEYKSKTGWPVCSGPNGTVSIMTEEEEEKYPSRIIGTISEVPDYEEWGTGKVKTNGRVWIRIK